MEMKTSKCNLIDSKLEEHHHLCGSKHCPGCGRMIEAATKPNWFGLPAGVKFDPTDQELIEHLGAKVKGKEENKKWASSHPLIDEFIPTIDGEDGICYTHPQKLPGVTRDGLSKHFFHKPSRAYTTGTRKRRKIIQTDHDSELTGSSSETRWHKTGKTRPVMINGQQRGCKKILVLYTNFGKNRRPEKTNWVMHQYHLGINEEEREGELVVSKIFYQTQPRQCVGNIHWSDHHRSSKDMIGIDAGDEISGVAAALQSLGSVGFVSRVNPNPFTRDFDEGTAKASKGRETRRVSGTCEEVHDGIIRPSSHHMIHDHNQHHQIGDGREFHIPSSSSSYPMIQTITSQHNSVFNITSTMPFQQQQLRSRPSGSGLEDVIMGCTAICKEDENSEANTQQNADWLTFPPFWKQTEPKASREVLQKPLA